jgi:hypothetical protein
MLHTSVIYVHVVYPKFKQFQVYIQGWRTWGSKHRIRIEVPKMGTFRIHTTWNKNTRLCTKNEQEETRTEMTKLQQTACLHTTQRPGTKINLNVPIGRLAQLPPRWPTNWPPEADGVIAQWHHDCTANNYLPFHNPRDSPAVVLRWMKGDTARLILTLCGLLAHAPQTTIFTLARCSM